MVLSTEFELLLDTTKSLSPREQNRLQNLVNAKLQCYQLHRECQYTKKNHDIVLISKQHIFPVSK
jgi:hypothetical protein